VNVIVLPDTTFIAENTRWSNMTGCSVNAAVDPGVDPAVPAVVENHPRFVRTEVVLETISPYTVPETTIKPCSPCTVVEEAVSGVPVTVPVVAVVAVNGVPVVALRVALENSPHSVIANVDV
jgi:hypothetical protein